MAPSILFDRNNAVMTDVLEASGAGDRPGPAALARSVMMQVDRARVGRSGRGDSRPVFTRRTRSLSEVGRGIAARLRLRPLTLILRPQDSPFFQQYELDLREPALGQGSFSVCRRCRQLQSGQEFAVKILSRRWAGPGRAESGRADSGRVGPEVAHLTPPALPPGWRRTRSAKWLPCGCASRIPTW